MEDYLREYVASRSDDEVDDDTLEYMRGMLEGDPGSEEARASLEQLGAFVESLLEVKADDFIASAWLYWSALPPPTRVEAPVTLVEAPPSPPPPPPVEPPPPPPPPSPSLSAPQDVELAALKRKTMALAAASVAEPTSSKAHAPSISLAAANRAPRLEAAREEVRKNRARRSAEQQQKREDRVAREAAAEQTRNHRLNRSKAIVANEAKQREARSEKVRAEKQASVRRKQKKNTG